MNNKWIQIDMDELINLENVAYISIDLSKLSIYLYLHNTTVTMVTIRFGDAFGEAHVQAEFLGICEFVENQSPGLFIIRTEK